MKWYWDRVFSKYSSFPVSFIIPPLVYIHPLSRAGSGGLFAAAVSRDSVSLCPKIKETKKIKVKLQHVIWVPFLF